MRKPSVTAQLSRTARRFSTVIAPQLTKIDGIPLLQKYQRMVIRITNIERLQEAIKQYVLHTNVHFDPVEFEIRDDLHTQQVVLLAQFYAEEIVLFEGTRRLLSICLLDPESPALGEGPVVAKVRHPLSGIKVFEVVESPGARKDPGSRPTSWQINGTMDEMNKCHIEAHSAIWRRAMSLCGFAFAPEWWSVEHEGVRAAKIFPIGGICEENAVRMEWLEDTENELRLLTLCFGVVQMIREAFPSLLHIIKEHRTRKSALA